MEEWAFLLDENVDPKTTSYLRKEGIHAEHVRDSVGLGADDESQILPYARAEDLILVTSDVSDFSALPSDAHVGIVLIYDDTMPAYRVAAGLISMTDVYPGRASFPGHEELDDWV